MYRSSSSIHVSDQSISISRAEILMTFFLMNPMPPDFGCRSLRFKRSEGERAPQRYVFKEIYLPMGKELMTHDCRYECLIESNCLSVNIGPPNKTGFRFCQLSTFVWNQLGCFCSSITANRHFSMLSEFVLQYSLSPRFHLSQWIYRQEIHLPVSR